MRREVGRVALPGHPLMEGGGGVAWKPVDQGDPLSDGEGGASSGH